MTRSFLVASSLLIAVACLRTADDYHVKPSPEELADLKHEACTAVCSTMDRCDPTRFLNDDPPDCYERCTTLMPKLDMANQCGSREMQWMLCLEDLTCEEYHSWDVGVSAYNHGPRCAPEFGRAIDCSEDEPFDLDEDNSHYP